MAARNQADATMRRFILVACWTIALSLCAFASACGANRPTTPQDARPQDAAGDLPPPPGRVDILFVVTRAYVIQAVDTRVMLAADALISELLDENVDFHFGVVSMTLPVPESKTCTLKTPWGINDGSLRRPQPSNDFPAPPPFLASSQGGPLPLEKLAARYAQSDGYQDGCSVAQSLESAKLAIERNEAGFIRPDSLLVVAFFGDVDDCSLADGVRFVAEVKARKTNVLDVCYNPPEGVLHPLSRYQKYFLDLAADRHVWLNFLANPSEPTWKDLGPTARSVLQPACETISPAPRLIAFNAQLGPTGRVDSSSIDPCTTGPSGAPYRDLGRRIARFLR
jgi:hypothetical protein